MRRLLSTACVLAALAATGATRARAAEGAPVDFLPTPSGNVGAFLVAGPFEKSQGGIERVEPAREGDPLSRDGLPGGLSWALATTRDGNGIVVGGPGADADAGTYYVRAEFPAGAPGTRAFSVVATSRATLWVGGETVTASPYTREKLSVEVGTGPQVFVLRLEVRRRRAAVAVRAGRTLPEGGFVPESVRIELADASEERLAGLVRDSLRLRVNPKLAQENTPVLVEFTRVGSPPDLPGEFDVELAAAGDAKKFLEPYRGRPSRRLKLHELGDEQVAASFMISPGAPGLFTIEAGLSREGVRLATLTEAGYVSQGLAALAGSLEERGRSLAQDSPGAGAYAQLQAEKVRLSLERPGGPAEPELLAEDIELAERALTEAQAGRDFQKGLTGFHERAYVSAIDDSAQPYLVYVPTYYDPEKRTPLVVYLHGYVPSYDKDAWLKGDPQVNAIMEAEGCILAIPFGRSNTDFLNVGEDDVLAVVDEMKKHYAIDPRRIYLYGYSMGGSGVWTLITHYPDRFAAAVVLAGRTDYYLWHSNVDTRRPGWEERVAGWNARLPEWRRFLIDTDNPLEYVGNIVRMPVRIYHGAEDYVVKREQSKRMADALRAAGGDCELYWVPGASHWGMFETVLWTRKPVAWLKEHVLPEEPPEEFKITARHRSYAVFRGVRFDVFRRVMEPAWIGMGSGEKRSVTVSNVGVLQSPYGLPGLQAVDGGEYFVERLMGGHGVGAGLRGFLRPWKEFGPIKDAFRSPFCIVYGTTGNEDEKREVRQNAELFRKEWRAFAKGWAPTFADTDVTDDLMMRRNLVLFGEPETNSVIANFADSLPIKWDRNEATFAGRSYSMKRRGLAFVYPNPKRPQRSLVIFTGIPWGDHLPSNHKWDLMPDFILYEKGPDMVDPMEKTNDWVVAGFFGTDWSLERGRIFVKGVGEVDAKGNVIAAEGGVEEGGVESVPEPDAVPEAPPGFVRSR